MTQHKNGDNENVRVATPFGGMSVKTNDNAQGNLGLTVYPGATREKKDDHGSDGAADVNFSVGNFHLGVRAATSYAGQATGPCLLLPQGPGPLRHCDPVPEQPARGHAVRTEDGLTCDSDDHHKSFQFTDSDSAEHGKSELRAGSKQHQHIVAVEKKDGSTKIGLVWLDLPTGMSDHDGENEQ